MLFFSRKIEIDFEKELESFTQQSIISFPLQKMRGQTGRNFFGRLPFLSTRLTCFISSAVRVSCTLNSFIYRDLKSKIHLPSRISTLCTAPDRCIQSNRGLWPKPQHRKVDKVSRSSQGCQQSQKEAF